VTARLEWKLAHVPSLNWCVRTH